MTTPQIIKLVHGSQELDLRESGVYWANDFVPPATIEEPLLASGSILNQYDGSILISKRAQDIELTFTVRCYSTTDSSARLKARVLKRMLGYGGDRVNPLQIHYRANSDIATEPLWGEYGANARYTIIHANTPSLARDYVQGDMRAARVDVAVTAVIKPYHGIKKMRVGSAIGGILEDKLGTVDGRSRGLIIPEATTNKMTNPVFGHATYDNGWTWNAGITDSQNTDEKFLYPGAVNSAKLVNNTAAGVVGYQTINVGNTNTHTFSAYVKRQDGAAVTASDVVIYYGGDKTSTYTSVGNGIYRVSWSGAGIAAGTATGIDLVARRSIYLLGYQCEENAYTTPLCWGNLPGCAWTGTAHASTSTRTAAYYRQANSTAFNVAEWTIRLVWKAPLAAADLGTVLLFDTDTNGIIRFYFNDPDNKFYLEDNTNTIGSSSAQTFAAGDVLVIHLVGEPGSLKIYVDGAQDASGSTYTLPTLGTYWYLGSNYATGQHSNGTYMGCAIYDYAASATEIANDYTNIATIIADDKRVGCIPWIYTKDGDDTVDNCDDSGRDNWALAGGIPGTAPAETEFVLDPANATYTSAIWLGLNIKEYGDYELNTDQYYIEADGTADAGGTSDASNGEHYAVAMPVAPYPSILLSDIPKPETLTGRLNFFVRLKASTGTPSFDIYPVVIINGVNNYTSTPVTKAASTTYSINYCGQINIDLTEFDAADLSIDFQVNFNGSATIWIDFCQIIDGPLMKIQPTFFDIPGGGASPSYFDAVTLNGRQAKADSSNYQPELTGDIIELRPDKLNRLYILMGNDAGAHDVTYTLTFNSIYVTPRYALL